jgi:hypothetical protein
MAIFTTPQTLKNYVGAKIIQAVPMGELTFLREVKQQDVETARPDRSGYLVIYPSDGKGGTYQSWSPKEVFESAYREVTEGEAAMIKG